MVLFNALNRSCSCEFKEVDKGVFCDIARGDGWRGEGRGRYLVLVGDERGEGRQGTTWRP